MEYERLFALAQSLVALVRCVKHNDVKSVICYKNDDYDKLNMVLPIRQHVVTTNKDICVVVQQHDSESYDILPFQYTKGMLPKRVNRSQIKCLQSDVTKETVDVATFVKQCEQMAVYYILYCCYLNCATFKPIDSEIQRVYSQLNNLFDEPNDGKVVSAIHEMFCKSKNMDINKVNELNKQRVTQMVKGYKLRINTGKAAVGTNYNMGIASALVPEFARFQLVYKDNTRTEPISIRKYICESLGLDYENTINAINTRTNASLNSLYEFGINMLLAQENKQITGTKYKLITQPTVFQKMITAGKKGNKSKKHNKRNTRITRKRGGVGFLLTAGIATIAAIHSIYNGNPIINPVTDVLGIPRGPGGLILTSNSVLTSHEMVNLVPITYNALTQHIDRSVQYCAVNGYQLQQLIQRYPYMQSMYSGVIGNAGRYVVALKEVGSSGTNRLATAVGSSVQAAALGYLAYNIVQSYWDLPSHIAENAYIAESQQTTWQEIQWEEATRWGDNYQSIVTDYQNQITEQAQNAQMWENMIADSGAQWSMDKLREFYENHSIHVDPFMNMLKQLEIDQAILESARTGAIDKHLLEQVSDNMDEIQRIAGDFYTASLIYGANSYIDLLDVSQEQKDQLQQELNNMRTASENLDAMANNVHRWIQKLNYEETNRGALVAVPGTERTVNNEKVTVPPRLMNDANKGALVAVSEETTGLGIVKENYERLLHSYASLVSKTSQFDSLPVFTVSYDNEQNIIQTPGVIQTPGRINKLIAKNKRYLEKKREELRLLNQAPKVNRKDIERVKLLIQQTEAKIAKKEQEQEQEGNTWYKSDTSYSEHASGDDDAFTDWATNIGLLAASATMGLAMLKPDKKIKKKRIPTTTSLLSTTHIPTIPPLLSTTHIPTITDSEQSQPVHEQSQPVHEQSQPVHEQSQPVQNNNIVYVSSSTNYNKKNNK